MDLIHTRLDSEELASSVLFFFFLVGKQMSSKLSLGEQSSVQVGTRMRIALQLSNYIFQYFISLSYRFCVFVCLFCFVCFVDSCCICLE